MPANFYGFEEDPPQRSNDSLFLWTVFILLLIAGAFACWLGSFYIFGHPEKPRPYAILKKLKKIEPPRRFEVTAAPPGEFLSAQKLFEKYSSLSPLELERENGELLRDYIRNFKESKRLVPYIRGRFSVIDSFPLQPSDFFDSGTVAIAQSADFPQVLIEHVYTAPPTVVPLLQNLLQPGLDLTIDRTLDLSAVIHADRSYDGRMIFTVVPLLYGTYQVKQGTGIFSLQPPQDLNPASPPPISSRDQLEAGLRKFNALRGSPQGGIPGIPSFATNTASQPKGPELVRSDADPIEPPPPPPLIAANQPPAMPPTPGRPLPSDISITPQLQAPQPQKPALPPIVTPPAQTLTASTPITPALQSPATNVPDNSSPSSQPAAPLPPPPSDPALVGMAAPKPLPLPAAPISESPAPTAPAPPAPQAPPQPTIAKSSPKPTQSAPPALPSIPLADAPSEPRQAAPQSLPATVASASPPPASVLPSKTPETAKKPARTTNNVANNTPPQPPPPPLATNPVETPSKSPSTNKKTAQTKAPPSVQNPPSSAPQNPPQIAMLRPPNSPPGTTPQGIPLTPFTTSESGASRSQPPPLFTTPQGVPLTPFNPTAGNTSRGNSTPVLTSKPAPGLPSANGNNWRVYPPGKLPAGRTITHSEARSMADRADLGEKTYLRGDFIVTASSGSKAVLRPQGTDSSGPTRIIVEYPSGGLPPTEGSRLSKDPSRAFEIRDVRRSADGQVNIFVHEVISPTAP